MAKKEMVSLRLDMRLWAIVKDEAKRVDRPAAQVVEEALRREVARLQGVVVQEESVVSEPSPVGDVSGLPVAERMKVLAAAIGAVSAKTLLTDPVAARELEKRKAARQNYLRSHPEDESQDPSDGVDF